MSKGLQIKLPAASLKNIATSVTLPIMTNLKHAVFFDTISKDKDFGGLKTHSNIGTPAFSTDYATMSTTSDGINTGFVANQPFTSIVVFYNPIPPSNDPAFKYTPIVGNWDAKNSGLEPYNHGAGFGIGVVLSGNVGVKGTLVASEVPEASIGTTNSNNVRLNVDIPYANFPFGQWHMLALRTTATTVSVKNVGSGADVVATALAGNVIDTRFTVPIAIGIGYTISNRAQSRASTRAALSLTYKGTLTDQQLSDLYSWVKTYMLHRGIAL